MALTSDVTGRRNRRMLPLGCIFWPGLLAISLLAGGAVAMSNWDTLSGLAKAGSVVLVVVGTLLLLPVLLMVSFHISMRRFFRQLSEMEQQGYVEVKQVYRTGDMRQRPNELGDDQIIDAPQLPKADEKQQ